MKVSEERRAYQREWTARNREKVRAKARERYANNPEHRAKCAARREASKDWKREYDRNYRARNAEKRHAQKLAYYTNFTTELLSQALEQQEHRCAICKRHFDDIPKYRGHRPTRADHCHNTGLPRGVLCNNCNTALGYLEDDVERLRAAIAYLERPPLSLA